MFLRPIRCAPAKYPTENIATFCEEIYTFLGICGKTVSGYISFVVSPDFRRGMRETYIGNVLSFVEYRDYERGYDFSIMNLV